MSNLHIHEALGYLMLSIDKQKQYPFVAQTDVSRPFRHCCCSFLILKSGLFKNPGTYIYRCKVLVVLFPNLCHTCFLHLYFLFYSTFKTRGKNSKKTLLKNRAFLQNSNKSPITHDILSHRPLCTWARL